MCQYMKVSVGRAKERERMKLNNINMSKISLLPILLQRTESILLIIIGGRHPKFQ